MASATTDLPLATIDAASKCIACGISSEAGPHIHHDAGNGDETWCVKHWNQYNEKTQHNGTLHYPGSGVFEDANKGCEACGTWRSDMPCIILVTCNEEDVCWEVA